MNYRIISLPPFRAVVSGVDLVCDFSPDSVLGRFERYFSAIKPSCRDSFMPRDFLWMDEKKGGMVWMYALSEEMDDGGYEVIDFPGGLYLTYAYRDGDSRAHAALYEGAMGFLEDSGVLVHDKERAILGHVITPQEVIDALGWAQMETFVPVKVK